jgi:hypothetical protein
MASPDAPICPLCGQRPLWGHEETCTALGGARTTRHEYIKYSLIRSLSTIPATIVRAEPAVPGRVGAYNDIRVETAPGSPVSPVDVDVSVVALTGARERATVASSSGLPVGTPPPPDPYIVALIRTQKVLERRAKVKYDKQGPPDIATPKFIPLIVSAGGLLLDSSLKCVETWRSHLSPIIYSHLLHSLSCALLTSRTITSPTQRGTSRQ